jgi:ATP adenylyltransferase
VNLVLFRGQHSFVILNRYPYTNGHLMIVPFDHQGSLNGLIPAARAEMMELSSLAVEVLREIYHTDAFNLGINLGSAAGAGVVGHVHIHVVPRWGGDTNFMTTLANTRVIPEVLEDTYARVTLEWYKRLNLPGAEK